MKPYRWMDFGDTKLARPDWWGARLLRALWDVRPLRVLRNLDEVELLSFLLVAILSGTFAALLARPSPPAVYRTVETVKTSAGRPGPKGPCTVETTTYPSGQTSSITYRAKTINSNEWSPGCMGLLGGGSVCDWVYEGHDCPEYEEAVSRMHQPPEGERP
jgi:hypothetical protein